MKGERKREENPLNLKRSLQCGDHICHQLLSNLVNSDSETQEMDKI